MGIPINIQTVYSQLDNVAKTAGLQQQAQLSEAMQQQSNIQKNLENNKKVQTMSNDKASSTQIKNDGRGSGNSNFQQKKENSEDDLDIIDIDDIEIGYGKSNRDPLLGSIVAITG